MAPHTTFKGSRGSQDFSLWKEVAGTDQFGTPQQICSHVMRPVSRVWVSEPLWG